MLHSLVRRSELSRLNGVFHALVHPERWLGKDSDVHQSERRGVIESNRVD